MVKMHCAVLLASPASMVLAAAMAASAAVPPPVDAAWPGTLKLEVDATDLDHRIFRVHEEIPVRPGALTLLYPQWLPGNHSPRGPIDKLAGLAIRADGRPLAWKRDPVEVYAFHLDVPQGVARLDVDFDFVVEIAGAIHADARRLARALLMRPADRIGDHPLDVPVVIDRIVLIAGREVEDPPVPSGERHPRAEHLAAAEARHEDEVIGGGHVEELPVHLLRRKNDRLRDAFGDRVRRRDGPHQLAVGALPPAQGARGAHQPDEDLGEVSRMQGQKPHPREHVAVHARHDRVGDVVVAHVAPPDQHVGACQALLGQSVLVVVEGGGVDDGIVSEQASHARGDRAVHRVGIDPPGDRVVLLMVVLAPDQDADRCCHAVSSSTWPGLRPAAVRPSRRRAAAG